MEPIGLDELVERAALLHRVDRKYVVDRDELPALIAAAPDSTRVLEIAGRREFGYRSAYLDTPDLRGYRMAGQRRRRRFKVRSRAYLDDGTCWLEVKTRGPRGSTVKERIAHHDAEQAPLSSQGAGFVDACLAGALVPGVRAGDLRPVLSTSYRRTTLFLPETASRVTLDTDLGWTALGAARGDLDRHGVAVVETKTGSTPSAFDRLLWSRSHRPLAISKYGVGVAALHGAPRLKWHHVLERHLQVPRTDTHHRSIR